MLPAMYFSAAAARDAWEYPTIKILKALFNLQIQHPPRRFRFNYSSFISAIQAISRVYNL